MRFAERVAIITGGASGIGAATAQMFAQQGGHVAIADRNEQLGNDIVKTITDKDGKAIYIRADVTDPQQVEQMVSQTVAQFGSLHYAANCAGIVGPVAGITDYPYNEWLKIININLTGVFLCMQAEVRQMLAQGQGGRIVNVASAMGLVGYGNLAGYTASKHGVVGLTRDAALEMGKHGILINAICPPSTRTPMYVEFSGGSAEVEQFLVERNHPIGRIAEPEDMAAAILMLWSDDARFVIGEALQVNGGWTVQ